MLLPSEANSFKFFNQANASDIDAACQHTYVLTSFLRVAFNNINDDNHPVTKRGMYSLPTGLIDYIHISGRFM